MACPNLVAEALEGLSSVVSLTVDLTDDRFDILYLTVHDGDTPLELMTAVSDLGYEPTVVPSPETSPLATSGQDAAPTHFQPVDPELAELMALASRESRTLLLDVYTPG